MSFDPETLARAQKGESDARLAFLRHVGPSLSALARRLGYGDEDTLAELSLHLLSVLPSFSEAGSAQLKTWVVTVAHRWLLMKVRKKRLRLVPLEEGADVASPARRPDEWLRVRELEAQLSAALERLPDELRRAFVLTQLHEQPLDAVAQVEKVPVGTMKSRVHRARAALCVLMVDVLEPKKGGLHAADRR